MKKIFCAFYFFLSVFAFAENSIGDVLKEFDEILRTQKKTKAQVTIGFITYEESNTCGSIVPYFQEELKKAAEDTRRINIVKTKDLTEYEQAGIATRGINSGLKKNIKSSKQNTFNIDGVYYDRGDKIELALTMHNADGKVFAKKSAFVPKSVVSQNNLTLFPENKNLADTIQSDFDDSEKELAENNSKSRETKSKTKSKKGEKINLAASMLDSDGNLVNMLYPRDVVKFKITANEDCYIAILCIDANGEKQWLPMNSNVLKADEVRFFPDIRGAVLSVADDGTFGAEQVVIYACSENSGLPAQTDGGKYSSSDLHAIMRRQKAARESENYSAGTFKITYTIMER